MLNISPNHISGEALKKKFSTLNEVENKISSNTLKKLSFSTLFILLIILFIPWTQNIRSTGNVTTLKPNQKPQRITSVIGGQIEKWYIQEGEMVQKGDTLLKISETKDAYFDPNLIDRTKNQVDLKKQSITTYGDKIINQDDQLAIIKNQRDLKLSQSKIKLQQAILKVQSDSIMYETSQIDLKIANYQLDRADSLFKMGLKSLTELELKTLKQQEVQGYKVKAENIYLNSKAGLIDLQLEISNVNLKYTADFNKIQSNQLSIQNNKINAESNLNKLENQHSNYKVRNNLYYIIAPQNGFITKISFGGVGEIVKPGQEIFTLMPQEYDLAVEIYIKPVDLPLIKIGEKIRIQFDGWPALVFSGWPNASRGTYSGEIYAIDQFISPNGKYRLLVQQEEDQLWPDALRFGSGASAMILLNDVPIWYELWRNINGFPPDFYGKENKELSNKKK
jgi:adhesin transport system membrane fusion protein